MEWISVSDRLPCEFEEVLVCIYYPLEHYPHIDASENKSLWVAYNTGDGWSDGLDIDSHLQSYDKNKVTHWMPLPDLPK